MDQTVPTRDKLLNEARRLFWKQGYSAVSLRDISGAAGVDVALVARYFGSKLGLFEATLDGAFDWPEMFESEEKSAIDVTVEKFSDPEKEAHSLAIIQMVLMNAPDPEVGEIVHSRVSSEFVAPICARLGPQADEQNVALWMSVLLGLSVARSSRHMPGIGDRTPEEFARQVRHMISAALDFES